MSTAAADDVAQPTVNLQATASALKPVTETAAASGVEAAPDLVVVTTNIPAPAPTPLPLPVPLVPATPTSATGVTALSSSTSRSRTSSTGNVASQAEDPTTEHVLLIGVDGTNLGRILDDPTNLNFFELMDTSVTAASTIVGHTTISNPSWTTILTGVWDTKSGVINNVFTPSTYNKWPTVFNQLEGFDPDIETKAIADWDVVADIARAGSLSADDVVYIPQITGDTNWSQTDAAVTTETVKTIEGIGEAYEDVPNFLFSYLVQVDENGHMFGGASPEYKAAIERTNTNIGLILAAVAVREDATGEDWTVIMVTDHGHQPQKGIGHGFQSPDETSTFVIADGPDFDDGQINLKYTIADITPTVMSLFGITPSSDSDGVPLTTLEDSQVDPVDLQQALKDEIAKYGYPDPATNFALSVRTIVGAVPYFVYTLTNDITAQLQAIVDQDIFLVSALAGVTKVAVQIIGDIAYAATNTVAQIVARLTGAGVIPPGMSTPQHANLPEPFILV